MDQETAGKFSEYYWSLSEDVRKRYEEKLQKIGLDIDPYSPQELRNLNILTNIEWPNVQYPDIYHYMINTPSLYTKEDLKAYKSLDSYNYFVSGWIISVEVT